MISQNHIVKMLQCQHWDYKTIDCQLTQIGLYLLDFGKKIKTILRNQNLYYTISSHKLFLELLYIKKPQGWIVLTIFNFFFSQITGQKCVYYNFPESSSCLIRMLNRLNLTLGQIKHVYKNWIQYICKGKWTGNAE